MPIILDRTMPKRIKENISDHFNIPYIDTFPLTTLPKPLNTHPDIQIHFVSPEIAICAPECFEYYKAAFGKNKYKLLKGSRVPGGTYPKDTAYNIARISDRVYYHARSAEPSIIEYYKRAGYKLVCVNQGYTKCSVCIAKDREAVAVTEDKGIYRALVREGTDALLIESGGVDLRGYDCGFIGGASGLICDTLVFTGSLPYAVRAFLETRGIEYFEASNGKLTDFGSIIYRR